MARIPSPSQLSLGTASKPASKKRKRPADDASEATSPVKRVQRDITPKTSSLSSRERLRSNKQGLPSPRHTPSQRKHQRSVSITFETPTKTKLQNTDTYATPPRTPQEQSDPLENPIKASASSLPVDLDSLIHLNSALLKALSLHVAHFGTTSPTDIRNLSPSVSKIWGKRKVALEDIRRNLGILQLSYGNTEHTESGISFDLVDYGGGSVCLEIDVSSSPCSIGTPPIDEQKLSAQFTANLQRLWHDFPTTPQEVTRQDTSTIAHFLNTLPLAELSTPRAPTSSPCSTTITQKMHTKSTLGQTRLTQLFSVTKPISIKSDEEHDHQNKVTTKPTTPSSSKSSLQSRQSSLAQRLALKSQAKAATSQPSLEDIARCAALQRIPEIVNILSADAFKSTKSSRNLADPTDAPASTAESSGNLPKMESQRKSYNLAALITKIQHSSRGILGKEDVRQCLDILHNENLAGEGFVRIVRIGGADKSTVVGVVVDVSKRIDLGELARKIALK